MHDVGGFFLPLQVRSTSKSPTEHHGEKDISGSHSVRHHDEVYSGKPVEHAQAGGLGACAVEVAGAERHLLRARLVAACGAGEAQAV